MQQHLSSKDTLTSILTSLSFSSLQNDNSKISTSNVIAKPKLGSSQISSDTKTRASFMTLHFLFPHELLPALDLLDRGLVKKFTYSTGTFEHGSSAAEVFYVQSASAVTDMNKRNSTSGNSRFRNAWNHSKSFYEVRLDSWSCSCAAFAYSQMEYLMNEDEVHTSRNETRLKQNKLLRPHKDGQWQFGGIATSDDSFIPICKHILAASLVKAAPTLFEDGFQNKTLVAEEVVAWAAGWAEI